MMKDLDQYMLLYLHMCEDLGKDALLGNRAEGRGVGVCTN